MANSRFYSSTAQPTTLNGTITSGATSMVVVANTFPTSFPYTLLLDPGGTEELVDVTAGASTTLTMTRAVDGTTAAGHNSGVVIRHVLSARDATDSRTHEAASTNVHGLSGGAAVVGDTSTQTLTNKTLTSPAISNPTMTGGGSLAGTYTGTPTLSGAAVFSGGPSFTTSAPSITSSLLTSWGGAWTAYTPTWGSAATAPAIGNGSLTGQYIQLGKVVIFAAMITMGTTSTFGTGQWTLTLPVAARTGAPEQTFHIRCSPTAGANPGSYIGQSTLHTASSTVVDLQSQNPGGTPFVQLAAIGGANPSNWAATSANTLRMWGTYEAA